MMYPTLSVVAVFKIMDDACRSTEAIQSQTRLDARIIRLFKHLLSPVMATPILDRPHRLAAQIAKDKLGGGEGLLPRQSLVEGLENGIQWRIRQCAMDFIAGLGDSPGDPVTTTCAQFAVRAFRCGLSAVRLRP